MPDVPTPLLWLALILGLLVALAWLLAWFLRPRGLPYFSRETLLSDGELAFYRVLLPSLPRGLAICMKVRLSDVINCSGQAWRQGWGARISQKHLDFVLIDAETTAIRLVIELDDRTHQRKDRRERDIFVDSALDCAGVPILRVPAAAQYDAKDLRTALTMMLRAKGAA